MASKFAAPRESLLGPPKRPDITHDPSAAKRKSKAPMGGAGRPSSAAQSSRPSTSGRMSNAPGRRNSRSSMYGSGPPGVKKDPRPLSDKSFQQASIRRLCAHLADSGYPQDLKPRALQAPSTKDFVYILNFLLEQIDESLMINGFKLDEEVPIVLKYLGYPFTVSKHHLLSVGSPHSWPIMLGILMWLIDGTWEDLSSQIMFMRGFEFEDGDTRDEEKFEMETELYHRFMEFGVESEEYQSLLQSVSDAYGQMYQLVMAKLEEVNAELQQLERNVQDLTSSSIPALEARIKQNTEDKDTFLQYITDQLQPRIRQLEEVCQEQEAAMCHTEMQIEATSVKAKDLEEQIRNQPMSAMEARKLKQSILDDRDMLVKMRMMAGESNQQVSELQMQHNQSVFMIDKRCREVNDKLRKLTAIMPDAVSLPTMDYDTSKRADPGVLSQLVSQTKAIKQGLQELNQRVATTLSETETQVINADSVKSLLQNNLTKKQLEVENAEHAVEIEKTSLQQKKKKDEEVQKAQLTERHTLERQLMALQDKLQDDSVRRKHTAITKQMEEERVSMAKSTQQTTEDLQRYGLAFMEYLETSRSKTSSVSKCVDELVSQFQEIRPPAVKTKYLKAPYPK